MKKVWYEVKDYVFIVVAVLLIRTFIITPARVDGTSMDSTLANGQLVIINKFIYRFEDIKRYDIVVVKNSEDNDKIIKRVIGLPGETVQMIDGYVYINDVKLDDKYNIKTYPGNYEEKYTLKDDEYFVMGDNRTVSKDSRLLGAFSKDDIVGRVSIRFFPFSKFGKIDK